MKTYQIKSIFEQISTNVFAMNNVNQAKTFINDFVNNKGINNIDKKTIINNVNKCSNINSIHRYICNSLLRYEGMGVS